MEKQQLLVKNIHIYIDTQVPMQPYFFKFLNVCKFAHVRKTLKLYSLRSKL